MFSIQKLKDKLKMLKNPLKAFESNETGYADIFKGLIVAVIAIVVVAILVSALVPSAISSIVAVNTTTWGAGAISMWTALPIFIVLVVLLLFVAILLGLL